MDVLIASTSTAGLSPLGAPSGRSHLNLSEALRARLGEEHASLLAEPVQTGFGDRLDWYASRIGVVQPLAALGPEDQDALRQRLSELIGDVLALSEELRASGDPQDAQLGTDLAHAMEIPSEESVFTVRHADGTLSPVLVNWGYLAGTDRQMRGVLTGIARRKPVPLAAAAPLAPPPPGTVAAGPRSWLWLLWLGWLLLGLLLATILTLLIRPCALSPTGIAFFCPVDVPVVASALEADRLVLEDEIATLEREIALLDRSCQPVAPSPVTAPEPQRDALDERLEERGGQTGDLNFALFWEARDDLDLHVTCPAGQTISFNRRQACGGTLDVDANVSRTVSDPVENIFFSALQPGTYQVRVHLFKPRTSGPKDFVLRVHQRNGQVRDYSGQVSPSRPDWRQTITVTE